MDYVDLEAHQPRGRATPAAVAGRVHDRTRVATAVGSRRASRRSRSPPWSTEQAGTARVLHRARAGPSRRRASLRAERSLAQDRAAPRRARSRSRRRPSTAARRARRRRSPGRRRRRSAGRRRRARRRRHRRSDWPRSGRRRTRRRQAGPRSAAPRAARDPRGRRAGSGARGLATTRVTGPGSSAASASRVRGPSAATSSRIASGAEVHHRRRLAVVAPLERVDALDRVGAPGSQASP